jgi:PKD repeat protein
VATLPGWLVLATLGLLLALPSPALATAPTTIGFDDLAPGVAVTNQYSADGVSFGRASDFGLAPLGTSDCGAPHVLATARASSAPNVAQATRCDLPSAPGPAPGTLAAFSFLRQSVSVTVGTADPAESATARMVAYSAAGVVENSTSAALVSGRTTLTIAHPSADIAFAAIEFDPPNTTTVPMYIDDLTVDNGAAALTATGTPFDATADTPFSGEVGRVQDADPSAVAGDFSGSIAWGDGSSSAATFAAAGSGTFIVTAGHTYAVAGQFAPVLSITKVNGRSVSATTSANVIAAVPGGLQGPPTLSPPTAAFTVAPPSAGRVAADASASAAGPGTVASYAWHVDGGTDPAHSALCGGDDSQMTTRLAAGTHTLALTVTNSSGVSSTTTTRLVVPRPHAAGRASAHAATASAAFMQVFTCTPAPQDTPGDVTAQGGPPAGCATEVQFGLVDAVGCLDRITNASQFPAAESKLLKGLVGSTSVQNCVGCAHDSRATGAQLSAVEGGIVGDQDPFVSRRPIRINGIDFVPHDGAAIVLLPQQNYVISSNAAVKLGGVTLTDGVVIFYVPQLTHGTASVVHIDDYKLSEQADRIGVAGLPFDGDIGLDLIYHRAQLPVHVTLPNVFTLGDGDPVQAAVTLSTDNTGGFKLDALHVSVPEVFLGVLEVDNLFFDYTRAGDVWNGGADLVFPGLGLTLNATPPPPDNGFGMKGGEFDHAGANLEFNPPVYPAGLETFPGVFLKHIGFTIGLNPTRFSGQVGVDVAGIADIDGAMVLAFPSSRSPYTVPVGVGAGLEPLAHRVLTAPSLAVGGDVALVTPVGDIGLGSAYFLYTFPDYVEFAGGFGYNLGDVFSVEGHVKGFAQPSRRIFNIEGGVHACIDVLGCTGVDAAISSTGIGVCFSKTIAIVSVQVGIGDIWGQLPDIYLWDCDVGPYEAHLSRATAAQAGAPQTFTLPAGLPSAMLRIRGQGDAPFVTVTGPGGAAFTMPTDRTTTVSGAFALVRQPSTDTTFIGIKTPAAGTWTVTPDAGSAPITAFAHANGLPAPDVHASVRGSGSSRALAYRVVAQPGLSVTFAERGPSTWHVIGTTRGGSGRLRFTPAPGPSGRRTIVALIQRNATTTAQHDVATFAVSPPAALRAPRLHVTRRGARVRVAWSAVPGAVRYAVTLSEERGGRRLVLARSAVKPISFAANAAESVRVRIVALSATNSPGRSSVVRLPRTRRPKVTRLPALRG